MSLFAPTLGALWKQLEGYGIDPDPVFREAGIDPEVMFDAGARVSLDRFEKLDLLATELAGDPDIGLKASKYMRAAHMGALGFAWLASSTLRTAFQRLSRYAKVIQEKLEISLHEDGDLFYVSIESTVRPDNFRVKEGHQLSTITKICRMIAGEDFCPARVCFQQDEPEDTKYHYSLFRCPIEFGSEQTQLVLHLEDLDRRLMGSNAELANLNEHIVVRYMAHSAKKDIVNQVKTAIIDGLANGAVTEKMVAESLFMTPRNLHRKLQVEESTFKQLLTDVRQDLARQYIQDRSKTLTEISYLLGFSEVSSFSRAFKGWTGKPPSQARQDVA
jgi:AraC-like DNA-binding protein